MTKKRNIITLLFIPLIMTILFNFLIGLGTLTFFVLLLILKIRKRGYFMLDKEGKKVTTKEFFKRWKSGIEGITPLQQAKTSLMGNWIVLSGIVSGMVVNALVRMQDQWWWIEIILGGSLILVVIQMIGGFQKYWRFKEIDKQMKEIENGNK